MWLPNVYATILCTEISTFMGWSRLDAKNCYWLNSVHFILCILYMIAHCFRIYCRWPWNVHVILISDNVIYTVCPESKSTDFPMDELATWHLVDVYQRIGSDLGCMLNVVSTGSAQSVCVWSCFVTSSRSRCRKILNNGTLSNSVWNSTSLPQRHLLL